MVDKEIDREIGEWREGDPLPIVTIRARVKEESRAKGHRHHNSPWLVDLLMRHQLSVDADADLMHVPVDYTDPANKRLRAVFIGAITALQEARVLRDLPGRPEFDLVKAPRGTEDAD